MHRFLPLFWLLTLSLFAPLAWSVGSTYYISDELVIGVYKNSDLSGEPVNTLRSGAPLEVVSRKVNAAKVRLPNGTLGWIDNDYLVSEKPDSIHLLSAQDEISTMKAEIESLQAELSLSKQSLSRTQSLLSEDDLAEDYISPQAMRLMKENIELKNRISSAGDALGVVELPEIPVNDGQRMDLMWMIIAAAVALLLGFIIGLLWLDRSIRRRHGGFRV